MLLYFHLFVSLSVPGPLFSCVPRMEIAFSSSVSDNFLLRAQKAVLRFSVRWNSFIIPEGFKMHLWIINANRSIFFYYMLNKELKSFMSSHWVIF